MVVSLVARKCRSPIKGELVVPTKPGLGLEFSRELDRYAVD